MPVRAEDMLNSSWQYYKKTFISKEGRVIDYQKTGITTSEGQSYALLRSLMADDKSTFLKVYKWTKNYLYNQQYGLFSWLWANNNGNWQVQESNTASDADVDIAFALILASQKWNDKAYLSDAKSILNNIWQRETFQINGMRVLVAGSEQAQERNVSVNLSYFAPYAFKVFAKIDKEHNWNELVDSSYNLTGQIIDKTKSGLPPDWFFLNKNTGEIILDQNSSKSDFSYDAVRTFLRFYVDYSVTNDIRAEKLLSRVEVFLDNWKKDRKFYTNYKSTGELKDTDEVIGSVASILPAIKIKNKELAEEIYQNKIASQYKTAGYWNDPLDYYAQNLVWFGVWIYLNDTDSFKLVDKILKE